jgi:hypothetical protein
MKGLNGGRGGGFYEAVKNIKMGWRVDGGWLSFSFRGIHTTGGRLSFRGTNFFLIRGTY